MRALSSLGIKQGVLPPQERPFIPILRTLGFYGTDEEVLQKAWKVDPNLVLTQALPLACGPPMQRQFPPLMDSNDSRVHFTAANLLNKFHRSFEAATTGMLLFRIFNHPAYFAHHPALPYHIDFADEGAANHTRFCASFDQPGIQLFVYGRPLAQGARLPLKFPARQSRRSLTYAGPTPPPGSVTQPLCSAKPRCH